jgi:enoyl-CoA hydratase/carnithine racemase
MVNEVCEPAELMPKVMALAKTICDNAPISVRQIKKAVNASMNMDLPSGLAFEIQCYERMISTEDRHEGVRAFNEKRKPQFKGK